MSKFRNRSIRALPADVFQVTGKPRKTFGEKLKHAKEDYFGENVYAKGILSNSTISSGESYFLNNLSSSSSLSWSDFEYENGTSEVLEELEKIDLVLKGELPVPPEYDRDEFLQWMQHFPSLRIFDEPPETPHTRHIIKTPVLRLNKSSRNCDKITSPNHNARSTVILKLNTPLVDQPTLLKNNKRLDNNNNHNHDIHNNKNIFTIAHGSAEIDIDNFLKISPIKRRLQERRQSNKSLIHAKEVFDHPEVDEFISLPFLAAENTKRNIYSSHSHVSKPKVKKKLVLPPIENSYHFRSVSATPRKPVKSNYERGKQSNLKDISEYYHTIRKQSSRLFV